MAVDRASRRRGNPWLGLLLIVGILLTVADVVLIVVLTTTSPPTWLWSMLSLSPWGPIALVTWALVARFRSRVRYLEENGVATRAAITSIGSTASQVGGRPVLKLNLSIQPATGAAYDAMVRTAPPYHLAGLLRPGVSLPVKVHPQEPQRLLVDWPALERETTRQP